MATLTRYQDCFLNGYQTENRVGQPILGIIEQYKNHPSIIAINNQNMDRQFSFQEITKSEINHEILNIDSSKDCQESDLSTNRSSHHSCSMKKGVLRNFTKFTGNHLCQSLFFNKVAGLRPATLLKKRLWHRRFPVNFVKFLRTPSLQNTSGRLLLNEDYQSIL